MALDRQCKIVLIGDGSVGKSSLIARFRTEGFAPRYHQTVGVDFFEKRPPRGAQGGGQIDITSGRPSARSCRPSTYIGARSRSSSTTSRRTPAS